MAEQHFKRKLTAILHSDVKDYSRLIGEDADATVRTLTAYREVMNVFIQKHRGRIVHGSGDSLLAEFISVVDAVRCAVKIQNELKTRNAELSEDRKVEFRIGIALGDVIERGKDLHGDGVNIAARVEALADGGGICITRSAYDQVKKKPRLGFEYMGEHSVKNIAEPVGVYRVLTKPEDVGKIIGEKMVPPKQRKMEFPLPDKASIAVLPFVNMSGDPEKEYIVDSITENIITALSYIPEMFVIARTSTSAYKGKTVKVKQVSEELGVRYVLEGSVMKAGDRIRVTAQLVDAPSGHHLWVDRYDRVMEDFFDLLDEIAKKVAIELQVKLTEGDTARISHKTENFEAWAYATTAYSLEKNVTKEDCAKAREQCEKSVKLDPKYGFAWGMLGATHYTDAYFGWSESRDRSFKLAVKYIDKALKLDETLPCATSVKGRLYRMQGQFDQAIAMGEKSVALGPSHDVSYGSLGNTLRFAGRFEESIALMKKAIRLNPHYPAWYLTVLAIDYFFTEKYEEAIEVGDRLLERAQKGEYPLLHAHLGLSAVYMELGKDEEAKTHAEEVLGINPKFSLDSYAKTQPYKNKADLDRYFKALRKSGLR